jgi:hypothetical protein
MAYNSNGAFNYEQLYHMPVYLRNFNMKQLEEVKKKEAEMLKSAQKGSRTSKR